MKTALSFLILFLCVTGASGQLHERIARSPEISYDWNPGFVAAIDLTGAYGLGERENELSGYYYGVTASAGYQFSRNIKAGIGTGVHLHNEGTLFPLFVDFRMNLNGQQIVPFISGTGGLMLDFNDLANESRVFINPLIGLRYIVAKKKAVTMATGLMVTTGGPGGRKSFLNLKLGVELKGK